VGRISKGISQNPQLSAATFTLVFLVFGSLLYYLGLQFIIIFTPVVLGAILATIIYFWEERPKTKVITISAVALSGFLIETLGVNTGIVFGDYSYGNLLGWKLFGTPLFIGLLWFLVSYSTYTIVKELTSSRWMRLTLGVVLIVSFDLILEQFAIVYKFWFWPGNEVPLLNYATWAVLGLLYLIFYELFLKSKATRFQLYASTVLPVLSIWLWLMILIKTI
jgi:uncharacterized membrane protein